MRLIKKYLILLFYFIPLAVFQVTILPFASFKGVAPDLLIILLVFYTLRYGQIFGTVAGFLIGSLFDLISGGLFGAFMFSKTTTGFLVGYIYNENKVDEYIYSYIFIIIIFASGVIDSLVYSLIVLSDSGFNILNLLFAKSLFPGLYTAAVAIPFLLFGKRKGLS